MSRTKRLTHIHLGLIGSAILCALLATLSAGVHYQHQQKVTSTVFNTGLELVDAANTGLSQPVRFYLSSHSELLAAAIWNPNDELIFPPTHELPHSMDQSSTAMLPRFRKLAPSTPDEHSYRWDDAIEPIGLHCVAEKQTVCFAVDPEALAELTSSPYAVVKRLFQKKGVLRWLGTEWIALMILAALCCIASYGTWPKTRESNPPSRPDEFQMADLRVFPSERRAQRRELKIALSEKDITLLKHLHQHPNQVISKQDLYDIAWGRDFINSSRALEQHIINLRKKLDPDKNRPPLIETVHGQGYRYPLPL